MKGSIALAVASALLTTIASAQMGAMHGTAKSGVDTTLYVHRGKNSEGLPEGSRFRIAQRPSNGAARIMMANQASPAGKPIRVAQVIYKSKKGFTGSDSFTYQRVARDGSVANFSYSISVVP